MRRAKLEGRHIGRMPLNLDRVAILRERERGQSLSQIVKTFTISRATVSRVLKQEREAVSKGSPPDLLQVQENRAPI